MIPTAQLVLALGTLSREEFERVVLQVSRDRGHRLSLIPSTTAIARDTLEMIANEVLEKESIPPARPNVSFHPSDERTDLTSLPEMREELRSEDGLELELDSAGAISSMPPSIPPAPSSRPQAVVLSVDDVKEFVKKSAFPTAAPAPMMMRKPTPRPDFFTMSDPIDALFDAMLELTYMNDVLAAANHCTQAIRRAVTTRGGIFYRYDRLSNEFEVVSAFGSGAKCVLGGRFVASDPVFDALSLTRAILVFKKEGEVCHQARHALFGDIDEVLIVPVISEGQVVGAIECIDSPLKPFDERTKNAVQYVADRFADVYSRHDIASPEHSGVVLIDPE
ncbi:MAG: GAF domain-containing protein [Polyangiaceae bacterium]|nr:GAF domain-containing protein [Polyangiaceae bacterium]